MGNRTKKQWLIYGLKKGSRKGFALIYKGPVDRKKPMCDPWNVVKWTPHEQKEDSASGWEVTVAAMNGDNDVKIDNADGEAPGDPIGPVMHTILSALKKEHPDEFAAICRRINKEL